MKTLEYRTVDKSGWGDGPWQSEPDKKQWLDPATQLPCLIVRNLSGVLCGYVGVAPGHPLYGLPYDDCEDLDVHGGLTFSGACGHGDEAKSICHVPGNGEPDTVWWFGFDCAHAYDLSPNPRCRVFGLSKEEVYRDVVYVTAEVEKLALQLKSHAA